MSVTRAEVRGMGCNAANVAAYLPNNYAVVSSFDDERGTVVIIEGNDVAGWTMADYVAPRLGSGLMSCKVAA